MNIYSNCVTLQMNNQKNAGSELTRKFGNFC